MQRPEYHAALSAWVMVCLTVTIIVLLLACAKHLGH